MENLPKIPASPKAIPPKRPCRLVVLFGKFKTLIVTVSQAITTWSLATMRRNPNRTRRAVLYIRSYRPATMWEGIASASILLAGISLLYILAIRHRIPVGIFIAIAGGLAAAVTLRKDPPAIEKALWILIIGIMTATEVHNLYVADKEQTENFDQVSKSLKATRQGLETTVKGLSAAANRINVISGEIADSSNNSNAKFDATLSQLREAINTETGGNSFCYLQAMRTTDDQMETAILSAGHYPLYAVTMRVVDAKLLQETNDIFKSQLISTALGDLDPPHSARLSTPTIKFTVPGADQRLNIFFTGRNGWWTELWRIYKVNGQWEFFMVVTGNLDMNRYPKGAVLMQASSKGFPKEVLDRDSDWQGILKAQLPHAVYSNK